MKKRIFLVVLFAGLLCRSAYGFDTALLDVRNKIFEESREIKPLIATSNDLILLSTMWDTCIIVISQLDAYFTMLGIIDEVDDDDLTEEQIRYPVQWLGRIRDINELNIRGIDNVAEVTDPRVEIHMQRLKIYLSELNVLVDKELAKLDKIKRAIRLKKPLKR